MQKCKKKHALKGHKSLKNCFVFFLTNYHIYMFIISTTCLQSMEELIHWILFEMWVQKLYTQNCSVWTDIQTDRKEELFSTLQLSSRTHKNGSVLHFLMTSVHLSGLTKNNISFEESGPDYSLCKFPIYHYIVYKDSKTGKILNGQYSCLDQSDSFLSEHRLRTLLTPERPKKQSINLHLQNSEKVPFKQLVNQIDNSNSVNLHEVAHLEPSHLDLHYSQIQQ